MKQNKSGSFLKMFYLLIGLFLLSGAAVCETEKAFLWKVQSDGPPTYLLGSIHVATKDFYPLPEQVELGFESSQVLAVEVNINEIDPLSMTSIVMESAFYQDEDSLKEHISPETYELVQDRLEEFGVDITTLDKAKPWFIAMMISNLELQKLGFDPSYGVDKHFLDLAVKENKKIVELESFDFQIRLLQGFSDKDQELFLSYEMMNQDTMQKEVEELMSAWKSGDAEGMEALLFKPLKENSDLRPIYEELFYKRNALMADKVESYLKTKQGHFVVVGSGHLLGEEGIVAVLRKKGYKVEQL